MMNFIFIILVSAASSCEFFRRKENVGLSLDQSTCVNRTNSEGYYYDTCVQECARQEECKAILFPVLVLSDATWCCLIKSQEVFVTNGNRYLIFDRSAEVHQCEDNIVTPCTGMRRAVSSFSMPYLTEYQY